MTSVLRKLLICATLSLLGAGPSAAGTIVVGLTVAPGKLTVRAAPATVAAGTPVSVPVTIADGRGSGAGWTLRVVGPTAVAVTSITARCAARSACTLPAAAGDPSGVTVLRAARGTGMGVIRIVVRLSSESTSPVAFAVS